MRLAASVILSLIASMSMAFAQIAAPPVPGPSGVAPPPPMAAPPSPPPPVITVPTTPGTPSTPGSAGVGRGPSGLPGDNPNAPGFPKTSR